MGGDGWCLSYYTAWAETAEVPRRIWWEISRPIFERMDALDHPPSKPCCEGGGKGGEGGAEGGGAQGASPPNACCCNLNLPVGVWAASLLPVMAQAGDLQSFEKVDAFLREHYRRVRDEAPGGRSVWLEETVEWAIGNTATYLLGLALRAGSSFREMVQAPRPLAYFKRPLLVEVACRGTAGQPPYRSGADLVPAQNRSAEVFRCWREDEGSEAPRTSRLHVGVRLSSDEGEVVLAMRLANVASVVRVLPGPGTTAKASVAQAKRYDAASGWLDLSVSLGGSEAVDVCLVLCCETRCE